MRHLLTILLFVISIGCFAQKNPDSLYFVRMKSRMISLPEKPQNSIYSLPFHNIQILDARPDTTNIGFLKHGGSNPNKLYFERGFVNSFNGFISNTYKLSNDTNNLLIIIKEFRISDYTIPSGMNDVNVLSWNSGAIISAELFLNRNNNYYALYKLDSILIAESNQESIAELIEKSFKVILEKSQNKNLFEMHIGKTNFSFNSIQKHANEMADFPILKDSILKKGTYKNFIEFKLNKPSITNYEVHKGKLSDELFISENNQTYPLQNFWGYCDGKNLFIYSAKNLFQLIKAGRTFDIRGMKSFKTRNTPIRDTTTYVLGNLIFTNRQSNDYLRNGEFKLDITAFQLNMQTGEIY